MLNLSNQFRLVSVAHADCMHINYTTRFDCLAIDRGQAGVPVGLKSAALFE